MARVIPRQYIIGILIFSMFIVGGVSLMSNLFEKDPTFGDQDKFNQFNDTFNIMGDVSIRVNDLESSVVSVDTDPGLWGTLSALTLGVWNSLGLLFSSFGFMDTVFNGFESIFGIPGWVGSTIIAIITVMLVFSIISAILQRDL